MSTLSVVINVFNEGHLLQECLETVRWADEIVITDMRSTDDSADVYRRYTDKVVLIDWEPVVERVRNLGFAKATCEWVLRIDPDERVSSALAHQIREIITSGSSHAAYRLPSKDYIFGRWVRYSGWQGDWQTGLVRLVKRSQVTWQPEVHSDPIIEGTIDAVRYDEQLDNAIEHINYTSVSQFLEKMNRYTSAEAESRLARGKTFHWLKLFYHPTKEFWRRYVRSKGYLDGQHGFILSLLMAFYVDLILIKMWEANLRSRKSVYPSAARNEV